jgi:hypothetical protein
MQDRGRVEVVDDGRWRKGERTPNQVARDAADDDEAWPNFAPFTL